MLVIATGATAIVTVAIGVFLWKTVNTFDGDEVRELTAVAAVVMPVLTGVVKLWEHVLTHYL